MFGKAGRGPRPEPDPRIGGAADAIGGIATNYLERFNRLYAPVENKYVETASNYATPEAQEAAAATAKADVASAAAGARSAAQREAASYGINPASGRFAGINRSADLATTLATGGAANRAREGVRDKGLALQRDLLGVGAAMPGAAAGTYGSQAGTLTSLFDAQSSSYNAAEEQRNKGIAGIGKALGFGVGLMINPAATLAGASFLSSKDAKTDKEPLEEGEALEAVNNMPVEEWRYKDDPTGARHVGPYAEDFQAETGKGDGQGIQVQDAIGVTMKAVQDLTARVEALEGGAPGIGGDMVTAGTKPMKAKTVEDDESMYGIMPAANSNTRRAA